MSRYYSVVSPKVGKPYMKAENVAIGKLLVIRNSNNDGEIGLRTFSGVVSLDNPENTWGNSSLQVLDVELCPLGFKYHMTVTNEVRGREKGHVS